MVTSNIKIEKKKIKGKDRFIIKDIRTGRVLDDANGHGYHTREKAKISWDYKHTSHYRATKWLKHNRDVLKFMDFYFKESNCSDINSVSFNENFLASRIVEGVGRANFEVSDLIAAWKTMYLKTHELPKAEDKSNSASKDADTGDFLEADNAISDEEIYDKVQNDISKKIKIYAYVDKNSKLKQIEDKVTFGEFKGRKVDQVFFTPLLKDRDRKKPDGKVMLLHKIKAYDVIITSSLTNFSLDFADAMQYVMQFVSKGARVIANLEDFDTAGEAEQAMLSKLSAVEKFKENSLKARTKMRNPKVYRELYHLSDFPNFYSLYNSYMNREITKTKFAETLGISTTTLNRLISQWERGER